MTHILKIDEMYSNRFTGRVNENANKRVPCDIALKHFFSRNSINAVNDSKLQYIEVLVDTSGTNDPHVLELFFNKISDCCDKFNCSGFQMIPYGTEIDNKYTMDFDLSDIREYREDSISRCVDSCMKSYMRGDLTIKGCVDFIVNKSKNPDRNNRHIINKNTLWVVFTDGEFDGKDLNKLTNMSDKVLFIICNRDFDHLEWCNDHDYDRIQRCYINLDDLK